VLDVGGRLQPYRPALEGRVRHYVGVDPQLEGLADVVAVGEHLPFADGTFDLAFCAQVLSYVSSPARVVGEIRRVLKPAGALLLSTPAFFPRHHDERWRFLPEGLHVLLEDFARVEIVPEGCSIAGVCRTINVGLRLLSLHKPWLRVPLQRLAIPMLNWCGLTFDGLSHGNERFTPNYSALAIK
jgi:SAM-dependent methyltransferase